MSVNHFSNSDLPESQLWWTQQPPMMDHSSPKTHKNTLIYTHQPPPSTTFNFNLNHQEFEETNEISQQEQHKEPMFEKPLTPSDVGKLNRLVIPKQHAEKYFPLGGAAAGDTAEKGLLLSFEDESGKPWRFRYSYWNSSQSYVLTKGWSRFVKEKRLDAGDVVLFERHRLRGDRLFIGWRRRTATVPAQASGMVVPAHVAAANGGNSVGWTRVYYDAQAHPSHRSHDPLPLSYQQPHCLHAGPNVHNNRQTVVTTGNPKRVRLFGVNLECPDESEPRTPDGDGSSASSSHGQGQAHYQYFNDSNHHNHNHNLMRYPYHQG